MRSIRITLCSTLLLNTFILSNAICQVGDLKGNILGSWYLTNDKTFLSIDTYFDQVIEIISEKEIVFLPECLEIRSGIFRLTGENGWPEGHYPWSYCGNYTRYELNKDSLKIFNPAYNRWQIFHVKMNNTNDSLRLIRKNYTLILYRKNIHRYDNEIKSIYLQIHDVNLFGSEIVIKDSLFSVEGTNIKEKFYSKAYADYIFQGFRSLDIDKLKKMYVSTSSENRVIELDFEYKKRKTKHIKIIGRDYPDELKMALLPLIYAGDFIKYKECWLQR